MAKQVIWSKLAHQDRKSILDFWINYTKSYVYSTRLNQLFENTAELISKHPKIGKKTEVKDVRVKIVKGEMPQRALKMIFEWLEIHRTDLLEDWELAQKGEALKKIKPLKYTFLCF